MSNAALVTNTAPTHPIRPATPDDFETESRHYAMVQDAHAARMPQMFRPMLAADFPVEQFNNYLKDDTLLLIAEQEGAVA